MLVDKQTADALGQAPHLAQVKGRSLWKDARTRFVRNRAAMVALFVLIIRARHHARYPHQTSLRGKTR